MDTPDTRPAADDQTLVTTPQSGALERDPSDWVSGDDPITPAQRSYLDTLAKEAGEQLPATSERPTPRSTSTA